MPKIVLLKQNKIKKIKRERKTRSEKKQVQN